MSDDERDDHEKAPEEKKSPVLAVKDGGFPEKGAARKLLGEFFDVDGANFMGSGMTFTEWTRTADFLRYERWYATQTKDERRRRMKHIVALAAEHQRICERDLFATMWSELCIEAVIAGDWNEVKLCIGTLKFEHEGPNIRNVAAPIFAKFVEIAQEAYDTRPQVYCPICRKPAPASFIGKHPDGRHVCPWCKVVHDDEGNYEDEAKANLQAVREPEDG